MGKSLLSIIADNERIRNAQKNIQGTTDDVQKSQHKEFSTSKGIAVDLDYANDKNVQSPDVSSVGDRVLADMKDLNVFPQNSYVRVDVNLNDASVIDMPELDDISKDIYLKNTIYNKYSSVGYIPFEMQDAIGVQNQGDYFDFINSIQQQLENNGLNLANIFKGFGNDNDSAIGKIGNTALQTAMHTQFEFNTRRETLGKINNQAFSVMQTKSLIRPDYDITVRAEPLERTLEYISQLQGFEYPLSYLPEDVFGFERRRVEKNGRITYIGSSLNLEGRIELLLQYTGLGQQQHLLNLIKLNQYNPKIVGTDETLQERLYIDDKGATVGNINARDFIATIMNTNDTGLGQFEPYGIVSIHKLSQVTKMVSDTFHWSWMSDIPNELAIGWTKNASNDFNSKSLLFKTQDIISNNSSAFLDLNDKQFVESVNEENRTISRGDSTTASGAYQDDDGTLIESGEYFRVWTKKRGYNRLDRTLRHRALDNGDTRSVLNQNGLVNFAPTTRTASAANGLASDDVIKRYMFSIENLAWADNMNDLPLCEQGVGDPVSGTRGRIMWFPPYDLKIDDHTTTTWESTPLLGRGEKIHTYNNSERTATLSFTIIVDHPDIVHTLVGEKTEYWERYFKGDKLIQSDALAKQKINKNLSQNEIDEIDKQQKRLKPIQKKSDKPTVTEDKKNKDIADKTKEKEDSGELGNVALSIYFPNGVTIVPKSTLIGQLSTGLSPNKALSMIDLKQNVGYEDGKLNDSYDVITTEGYIIKTGGDKGGIRYTKKNGDPINKIYTYNDDGKLKDSGNVCVSDKNSPTGYQDKNNLGKNTNFYFEYEQIFKELFENKTKVHLTFVGNASGASPNNTTNQALSEKRANNAKKWFDTFVKPKYSTITFTDEVTAKSDSEDAGKSFSDIPFCKECDNADEEPCKNSRRVDIYVKILDVDEPAPDPIVSPSGDTTIVDDEVNPNITPDDDELNVDTDDDIDLPVLEPNILKRLVYTECDYFKYLETYEPTMYQTISERIKYFWAAYHSITPQGFNSRLTFLQQCMRQGDSIGRDGIENWKNLAFGRPPVCILRIGDFYHTRIIINTLAITFGEEMTWDLNPEGIGVQPMLANISLGITILGGSSMSAPLNRLQNALSFNYYANTEMYDARADSVIFTDEPEGENATTFGTLKNGKIVDGIRLSTITNYSKSQQEKQLAELRKQSRVALPNSTDANADNVETLGQVGSMLEMKKRLGLSLSGNEKIDIKTSEVTNKKFSTTEIEPVTLNEVKNSSVDALKNSNSVLNEQAYFYNEGKLDKLDFDTYYNQYMQQQVSDPTKLTPKGIDQTSQDFLNSNREIYFDNKGNRINYQLG